MYRHYLDLDGTLYLVEVHQFLDGACYARVLRQSGSLKISLFDGHCARDYQPELLLAQIHGEAIARREHAALGERQAVPA